MTVGDRKVFKNRLVAGQVRTTLSDLTVLSRLWCNVRTWCHLTVADRHAWTVTCMSALRAANSISSTPLKSFLDEQSERS